jgi:hypothetical protein
MEASVPDVDIDPSLCLRILEEAADAGEVLLLTPVASEAEQQLVRGLSRLVQVVRGQAGAERVGEALSLVLRAAGEQIGIVGAGESRSRRRFQPQRQGLTAAAGDLIADWQRQGHVFYNAPINLPEVQRITDRVSILQEHVADLSEAMDRAEGHLRPLELRLYQVLARTWTLLSPVFAANGRLRRWGALYYRYMTERHQRGVATRKDRQAQAAEVEEKTTAAAQAAEEKAVRDRVAEDLADAFMRKLQEER